MEKRKKLSVILCLVFIICAVSCSMFEAEDETENMTEPESYTEVRFCIQKAKSLSMSYPDGFTEKYQYKATPHSMYSTKGIQTSWTDFENNSSVGEFAKGNWTFEFRVIYGDENSYGVISLGSKNFTVSGTSCTVNAVLQNVVDSSKNGSMAFSVRTKAVSEQNGSLEVFFDDQLTTISDLASAREGDEITFTGTANVKARFYTLRFKFYDETIEASLPISSETMVVRIVEDATVKVSGMMASETYSESKFSIIYPKILATLSHTSKIVTSGTDFTFTCNARDANEGSSSDYTYNYIWYVNGVRQDGKEEKTFSHTFTSGGVYNVSCVVWCMDNSEKIYGSISEDIQVN